MAKAINDNRSEGEESGKIVCAPTRHVTARISGDLRASRTIAFSYILGEGLYRRAGGREAVLCGLFVATCDSDVFWTFRPRRLSHFHRERSRPFCCLPHAFGPAFTLCILQSYVSTRYFHYAVSVILKIESWEKIRITISIKEKILMILLVMKQRLQQHLTAPPANGLQRCHQHRWPSITCGNGGSRRISWRLPRLLKALAKAAGLAGGVSAPPARSSWRSLTAGWQQLAGPAGSGSSSEGQLAGSQRNWQRNSRKRLCSCSQ